MNTTMTGKELADTISRFVNPVIHDTEGFTKTVLKEHPTLQQSVMRLCFDLIRAMANQNNVDPRNERSVSACKKIIKMCDDEMGLPLI